MAAESTEQQARAHRPTTGQWVVVLLIFVVVLIGGAEVGRLAFGTVGAEAAWGALWFGLWGLVVVGLSGSWLANAVLRRLAKDGAPPRRLAVMNVLALWHDFQQMDDAQGRTEWSKVYQLPKGGQLLSAWACRRCGVTVLKCTSPGGDGITIEGGTLPPQPWVRWIAGLYLRGYADALGDPRTRWRLLALDRDLSWVRLDETATASLCDEIGYEKHAAVAWSSGRCPARQLGGIDADGRDFLLTVNAPAEPEPRWYAGIFVAYARRRPLASDEVKS
jgi:hypothetical protein